MTPFRDLPIRRKVARAIILTSTIVLLLTSSAFMMYEWVTFRRTALTNLRTLSRVIADNSTAALIFKNETDARETIATLRAEPDIVSVAIHDETGRRVAFYATAQPPPAQLGSLPPEGHVFSAGKLVVYEPIVQDHRPPGTLMVQANPAGM